MAGRSINPKNAHGELLAELADAAYRFALHHGFKGSFVEVELGLWKALRAASVRHRRTCRVQAGGPVDARVHQAE
jgi:hypothetical protein